MPPLIRAALLLLLLPLAARAQPADPAWQAAWDYMLQDVCPDAQDRPTPGATPLDACPRPRKLRPGERLPYHKRDWPGAADTLAQPEGYQQSDSIPIRTALGPAVLQTYDFGDGTRAFNRWDSGDGGQVVFFTARSAGVGVTEDGGAGLQLFLGPSCTPVDSWVIVDRSFPASLAGQTVATLTRRADRCATRPNQAFTRWTVTPIRFRTSLRGRPGGALLDTLVSEHFDAGDPAAARAMERMYFTHKLGYTRWEAWRNAAVADRAQDRTDAARLAASGRCGPALPPPAPGWAMVDCREWTRLVPPSDAAGDPPFAWLDRLRTASATAALFPDAAAR